MNIVQCVAKNYTQKEVVKKMTEYEKIMEMSAEELAEWLYANCEYLSSEYGACSGASDSSYMFDFLNSDSE